MNNNKTSIQLKMKDAKKSYTKHFFIIIKTNSHSFIKILLFSSFQILKLMVL